MDLYFPCKIEVELKDFHYNKLIIQPISIVKSCIKRITLKHFENHLNNILKRIFNRADYISFQIKLATFIV